MSRSISILIIVLFFFSCKKEKQDSVAPKDEFFLGKEVRINDLQMLNDSVWIACGGIRNKEGYVFKTVDAGKTWSTFATDNNRSVYCVSFRDDLNGFAGGDFLDLWRTNDGGNTWQFYWLAENVPTNEEDRPAIRDFHFVTDSSWYFCGGENLFKGVFYHTKDAGNTWQFQFIENEFRSIVVDDNLDGILGGHGAVLTFQNGGLESQKSNFADDFMTGLTRLNNGSILGVSYEGSLYKSGSKGKQWEKLKKFSSSRLANVQWNDISSENLSIVAVGNYGHVLQSSDGGNTWNGFTLAGEPHLLKCVFHSGKTFITTNDGRILGL